MGLTELLNKQLELQKNSYCVDPRVLTHGAREEYVRNNVLHLTDELHEAMHELSWKPWGHATETVFNRDAFLKELIDALHFLMNLMLVAGGGHTLYALSAEVVNGYLTKREINAERQRTGVREPQADGAWETRCGD